MSDLIKSRMYDLEERTAVFGATILLFAKKIGINDYNRSMINQLIRSGTSVGANYMEATMAESRKDFIHKLGIVCKELKEVKHWLRMLVTVNPEIREESRAIWKEAHELTLIISKSINTARAGKDK